MNLNLMAIIQEELSKIKDGVYIIDLDEYELIGHWIALYVNAEKLTYFDSVGRENIPKEMRKFIRNKNIIAKIYTGIRFGNMWILLY